MHSLEAYISNTTFVMIYNDFLVLQLDYQERSIPSPSITVNFRSAVFLADCVHI